MKLLKRFLSWKVLLVLLVILLAYGQTLLMYFWQDDSALIFKLMNPEGRAGSFGYGIIGSGAYKYLVTPFVPFFPLFGKEPFGYFLVGLMTYGIATWAFYFFALKLFETKKPAYLSTLLFAAGYVGSDTMFRIINSWQTNVGLALALVSLGIYVDFLKTNGFRTYLLSVVAFLATVELVFIRSHSLIVAILLMDLVYRVLPFQKRRIPGVIIRFLPFAAIFYRYYMTDASFGAPGANSIVKTVLSGDFVALSPYFANFGYTLVPNVLQSRFISLLTKELFSTEPPDAQVVWFGLITIFAGIFSLVFIKRLYKLSKRSLVFVSLLIIGTFVINNLFFESRSLWYRKVETVFSGGLGMSVPIVILYLAYGLWKEKKEIARALLVGLFIAATQYVGYFVQYPTAIFPTHHRYYSHSLIGTAVLFAGICYLWFRDRERSKFVAIVPFVLVLGMYITLDISYQRDLVLDRAKPSRQFYTDLQNFVPDIEKGSAFYFDIANRANVATQFGDFFSVGSMPESTALAMYYDVDRYEVFYLTDFNELLFKIDSGEIPLNKVYTFYVPGYNFRDSYSTPGLIDTTNEFRSLISLTTANKTISSSTYNIDTSYLEEGKFVTSKDEVLEIKTDISSVAPQIITFDGIFEPQAAPEKLPYVSPGNMEITTAEIERALDYLNARNNYYKTAIVQSTSDWKFREIEYIHDNDAMTPWQGHRIWWHENGVEDVTIDLGSRKLISKLIWTNWKTVLAPTSYEIQVSLDGAAWQTVKRVDNGPERKNTEVVVEEFESTNARYIRMHITGTQTNDSPGLVEIEVIESEHNNVDFGKALSLIDNPYVRIGTIKDWSAVTNKFLPLATAQIAWKTNDTDTQTGESRIPLFLDGEQHTYEFVVPASGTRLETITISFPFPISGEINNFEYANLTLDGLRARGLIKEYKEN